MQLFLACLWWVRKWVFSLGTVAQTTPHVANPQWKLKFRTADVAASDAFSKGFLMDIDKFNQDICCYLPVLMQQTTSSTIVIIGIPDSHTNTVSVFVKLEVFKHGQNVTIF
jgi:hypothetical protein